MSHLTTQDRLDASDELPWVSRLDEIVIRTTREEIDLALEHATRGEDDDRREDSLAS